jgi:hypothetical protein
MSADEKLKSEIKRWSTKIEEKRRHLKIVDDSKKEHLINMDAYISDSKHFEKEGKIIESFEALLWAWSILEIGEKENWWKC